MPWRGTLWIKCGIIELQEEVTWPWKWNHIHTMLPHATLIWGNLKDKSTECRKVKGKYKKRNLEVHQEVILWVNSNLFEWYIESMHRQGWHFGSCNIGKYYCFMVQFLTCIRKCLCTWQWGMQLEPGASKWCMRWSLSSYALYVTLVMLYDIIELFKWKKKTFIN
jgi:hypothetical protein